MERCGGGMKAVYQCYGCKARFEANADSWSDADGPEIMMYICPECGRMGSAIVRNQYPAGCMRVWEDS